MVLFLEHNIFLGAHTSLDMPWRNYWHNSLGLNLLTVHNITRIRSNVQFSVASIRQLQLLLLPEILMSLVDKLVDTLSSSLEAHVLLVLWSSLMVWWKILFPSAYALPLFIHACSHLDAIIRFKCHLRMNMLHIPRVVIPLAINSNELIVIYTPLVGFIFIFHVHFSSWAELCLFSIMSSSSILPHFFQFK